MKTSIAAILTMAFAVGAFAHVGDTGLSEGALATNAANADYVYFLDGVDASMDEVTLRMLPQGANPTDLRIQVRVRLEVDAKVDGVRPWYTLVRQSRDLDLEGGALCSQAACEPDELWYESSVARATASLLRCIETALKRDEMVTLPLFNCRHGAGVVHPVAGTQAPAEMPAQ